MSITIDTKPSNLIRLSADQSSTAVRIAYDRGAQVLTIEHSKPTKGDGCAVYRYPGVTLGEWEECTARASRPATWVRRNLVVTKRPCVRMPGLAWCEWCGDWMRRDHDTSDHAPPTFTGVGGGLAYRVTELPEGALRVEAFKVEEGLVEVGVPRWELRQRWTSTDPLTCRGCGDDAEIGMDHEGRYLCVGCLPGEPLVGVPAAVVVEAYNKAVRVGFDPRDSDEIEAFAREEAEAGAVVAIAGGPEGRGGMAIASGFGANFGAGLPAPWGGGDPIEDMRMVSDQLRALPSITEGSGPAPWGLDRPDPRCQHCGADLSKFGHKMSCRERGR